MPYEILEHMADVRVLARGNSLEELFSGALSATMEILTPNVGAQKRRVRRVITVESADQTALLVDFLNEVLLAAYNRKEAYDKIVFKSLKENSLRALLYGRAVQSFSEDIKAITHHEAEVRKDKNGKWSTYLVFDI